MSWIKCKSVWFGCPHFADVFEGCESLECLEPPLIIVGVNCPSSEHLAQMAA